MTVFCFGDSCVVEVLVSEDGRDFSGEFGGVESEYLVMEKMENSLLQDQQELLQH